MVAKMSSGLLTGLLLFFLVLVMIQVGEAILQDMPPTDTRCECQEINSNVDIISEDHSTISVKRVLIKVNFGEKGNNVKCGNRVVMDGVSLNFPYNKNISINVGRCKTTQKEKIEGMEVEIRKLEGTVKAIHENLLKLING
ncbi:hypothetical protein YC2023_112385 [Brassica napus]